MNDVSGGYFCPGNLFFSCLKGLELEEPDSNPRQPHLELIIHLDNIETQLNSGLEKIECDNNPSKINKQILFLNLQHFPSKKKLCYCYACYLLTKNFLDSSNKLLIRFHFNKKKGKRENKKMTR
mgnify:CR=1 FL=1